MTSSLQLCAPCQMAVRTNRIADIKGPTGTLGPNSSLSIGWECAFCTTIANERARSRSSLDKGLFQYLQIKVRSSLDLPNDSRMHSSYSRPKSTTANPPNPPISDINDLLLVSSKTQRSECRFEPKDIDDLKYTPEPAYPLRIVPKNTIDPLLVRKWLLHCESNHESCNHQPSPSGSSLLLIDVQRLCLVSTVAARYFALSYVWGKTDQFVLKEADLSELQKENSLRRHWHQIAPVLQDAITFVANLSEKYLWVDTLCIAQDSPKREAYFSRMNEIYQGAVCTLAATEATDATCRLPGVGLDTRVLKCLGENYGLEIARRRTDLAAACINSSHESRAWTFQERTLSKRCLYFLNEQVQFQCHEAVWSEDRYEYFEQHFGTDYVHPSLQWIKHYVSLTNHEKFQAYSRLVTQYSKKQLTYSWDRLNAFSGFTSYLEEEWAWQFACGIPTKYLDTALLWVPTASCLRRVEFDSAENYLPTWSWAGWIDGVSFRLAPNDPRWPAFRTFGVTNGGEVKIFQISAEYANLPSDLQTSIKDDVACKVTAMEYLQPTTQDANLIDNILVFWTETVPESRLLRKGTQISLQKFYGEDTLNRQAYRIYGSEGPAGLLVHRSFALKRDCEYEYILISSNGYGTSLGPEFISALHDEVLDEETDGFDMDNIECKHYCRASWRRMFIMLTRTTQEGYRERIAVGWIHQKAWVEAKPVRKKIFLG